MGTDWTNASEWERAVDSYDTRKELARKWDRLTASRVEAGDWELVEEHVRTNEAVVIAVDYGVLRRKAPRKTGSESFDGYHSVTIVGRKTNKPALWRDYDSLNDGRYRGCPRGPVFMPRGVLKEAALQVGREVVGRPVVWAILVNKAERIEDGVDITIPEPVVEPDLVTMGSVLADLYEFRDTLEDPKMVDQAQKLIDDYEAILGIEGDELDVPTAGVSIVV